MPLFCPDLHRQGRSPAVARRQSDAHLAYLRESGVVRQAGPFLDPAGAMCGSLVVIEVDDRATAQAWAAGDPYAPRVCSRRCGSRSGKVI